MSDKSTKRYMELQMEELKETYGIEKEVKKTPKDTSGQEQDREIAELYADAWEYEQELEIFQQELEIIKNNTSETIASQLDELLPSEERDYAQELKTVLESTWKHLVETKPEYTEDQLAVITASPFEEAAKRLLEAFPDFEGDFEREVKGTLIQRWDLYIEVKKDHIKDETDYIKALGLKPHYAKKIYKRYHGID